MRNDFDRLFESILDDMEADSSSQAQKVQQTYTYPFNADRFTARTDFMCGAYWITAEQLEDFADICRVVLRKFSWPHGDIVITTSDRTFADTSDELSYYKECGEAIDHEYALRFSFEYNIPDKLTVENLTNMMLLFEKVDSMFRFIFKRCPVYNSFFADKKRWHFIGRPDAIELFDSILYPNPNEARNGNATESLIREISGSIIRICAATTNARVTIPLLRQIFRQRLERMRLLRKS